MLRCSHPTTCHGEESRPPLAHSCFAGRRAEALDLERDANYSGASLDAYVYSTGLGAGTVAGRVLVICGTDGRGRPYRSEMLVFRDGSGLRAINPIFWDNMAIATGTVNPPTATPVPGCGEST